MKERGFGVKKILKSVFSACVLFLLTICNALITSAEDDLPYLIVKGGYADENNLTSVSVSIDSEICLAAYSISLIFDPSMLEFADASGSFNYGKFFYGNTTDDCVTIVWSDSKDHIVDGNLFTARFKTKNETDGKSIPVEIGYSIIGSESTEEIPFKTSDGVITVVRGYKCGDANCDGAISLSDAIAISRFNIDSEEFSFSDIQLINSDTDNNNKINMQDTENVLDIIIKRR